MVLLFSLIALLFISCTHESDTTLPEVGIFVWDEKAKEGSDAAEIRLIQVGKPTKDLEIQFKIEGSAKAGYDFRPFSKTVKMDKSKRIRIIPVQDRILEGTETARFTLVENSNYRIEKAHASAAITLEDGELPDVQFVHPSSGDIESCEKANLIIQLSESYDEEVEVEFTVREVLAERGMDYQLKNGSIKIKPGSTEAYIPLNVLNDDRAEDDETVIVRLTNATNANIGRNESHYYTIKNDDGEVKRSLFYDRIYGALIGFRSGCAMGAPTELHFTQEQIADVFGMVDTFMPYVHYGDTWSHPAGATEDGGERHKLMCTAIIDKQDRIDAGDLLKIWLRDCELEDMYHMTQPYDRYLMKYAEWGIPGDDLPVTRYGAPFDLGEHIHLTARTFQAVPCINAGDPENAIADMNELGQLYYEDPGDDAFLWGAVYNAAMALAMLPDATVESVIEGAMKYATPEIEKEIRHGLAIVDGYDDPMNRKMWKELTNMYGNPESPYYAFDRIEKYQMSSIYENVTCAFAIFKATRGNVEQSVVIATNRGRDTDCTAASACALSGALTGTSTIPKDWFEILESGIADNPYTNSHMTNKGIADGMYRALQNKVRRMAAEVENMNATSGIKNEKEKKMASYVKLMREHGLIE